MEEEYSGKFFVWTKKGRAPRFAHDTHESALAEARRLAFIEPGRKFIVQQFLEKVSIPIETPRPIMGNAAKEPAMNERTIWYGAKNNEPVFSENKADLTGIDNPRSFTVSGDIQGLNLVSHNQQQTSQQGSQQPA